MGNFTLGYLALLLSASTSACTGTVMTKNDTEHMSFTQDTVGMSRPAPPTSVTLDGEVAYLLIRKSAKNSDAGTGYLGIGKYALAASPELKREFGLLAKALSSQPLPSPKPARHQNVIRYDFELAGKSYSGAYDFSLGHAFNSKLKPFGEIKGEVLNKGTQLIGFRPEVRAQAADGTISVFLTMTNTGQVPLELLGPSGWGKEDGASDASVTVGISSAGQDGWIFHLDAEHLIEADDQQSKVISIGPGQSAMLRFRYPMSASGELSGQYVLAARMRAIVLTPHEFKGPIETGLDQGVLAY